MLTVYDGNLFDTTDRESEYEYELNSCGRSVCRPEKQHITVRERGRKDYHILYVLEGECLADYEGREYRVGESEFLVYCPGQRQKYLYELNIKTVSFWIHFSGRKIPELMKKSRLCGGVYESKNPSEVCKYISLLLAECVRKNELSDVKRTGLLLCFLTELSRSLNPVSDVLEQIDALKEYVHTNYNEKIDAAEFAKNSGLSTDRFLHIFKKEVGKPFHKYCNDVRLFECARMLRDTDISVKETAYFAGFSDPLYFSRAFKKYVGISPSEYAKKYR